MSETHSDNTVNLNHSTIIKRNDGIVEVQCGREANYEIEQCREVLKVYETMIGAKRIPILHIVGEYTTIAPEARAWGSSEESTRFSKAEAYVIKSLPHRLLANFYMKFDKPPIPTKFFNTVEEAEQWLKTYL